MASGREYKKLIVVASDITGAANKRFGDALQSADEENKVSLFNDPRIKKMDANPQAPVEYASFESAKSDMTKKIEGAYFSKTTEARRGNQFVPAIPNSPGVSLPRNIPIVVTGYSLGSLAALLVALELKRQGYNVTLLIIDAPAPEHYQDISQHPSLFTLKMFCDVMKYLAANLNITFALDQEELERQEKASPSETTIEQLDRVFKKFESSSSSAEALKKLANRKELVAHYLTATKAFKMPEVSADMKVDTVVMNCQGTRTNFGFKQNNQNDLAMGWEKTGVINSLELVDLDKKLSPVENQPINHLTLMSYYAGSLANLIKEHFAPGRSPASRVRNLDMMRLSLPAATKGESSSATSSTSSSPRDITPGTSPDSASDSHHSLTPPTLTRSVSSSAKLSSLLPPRASGTLRGGERSSSAGSSPGSSSPMHPASVPAAPPLDSFLALPPSTASNAATACTRTLTLPRPFWSRSTTDTGHTELPANRQELTLT